MNKYELIKNGLDAEKVRLIEIVIDGEHLFTDITSLVSEFMHIADVCGKTRMLNIEQNGDSAKIFLTRSKEPKPCKVTVDGNKIKHEIFGDGEIIEQDKECLKCKFESGEKLLSREMLGI